MTAFTIKLNGIFIYSLNVMSVPNLSSAGCFEAQLESVTDARMHAQTDRRKVKIVLTPALLDWCQGLSWAMYFSQKLSMENTIYMAKLMVNPATYYCQPFQGSRNMNVTSQFRHRVTLTYNCKTGVESVATCDDVNCQNQTWLSLRLAKSSWL